MEDAAWVSAEVRRVSSAKCPMKGLVFWKNASVTKMSSRPIPSITNGARKWMKVMFCQSFGAEYTSHDIGKDICTQNGLWVIILFTATSQFFTQWFVTTKLGDYEWRHRVCNKSEI